ncbi:MAG: glycerol-3-phosphate acyltransferase, partial [Bacteroidales bacterium]|nr:glycerol-3-phosphate acyltransferase [Bacteroidales bacterium]
MITITNILLIILAYLIGSIPSSVWIGKIFFNTDIRKFGSKNAGTTNTFRVLGYKAGLPVLFIDILKGYFAVSLVLIFKNHNLTEIQIFNFQLILGLAAILGHIFPIFAKFKGGKGVATLLGIFLSIALFPTLISLFAFILIL